MLIFGGSKFKEREPNDCERSDLCLVLSIPAEADKYTLEYLPGARLKTADKFFSNMQTRIDANHNTVTVIGQRAVHRINTGRRNLAHLKWKACKPELGYGNAMVKSKWHQKYDYAQSQRPP